MPGTFICSRRAQPCITRGCAARDPPVARLHEFLNTGRVPEAAPATGERISQKGGWQVWAGAVLMELPRPARQTWAGRESGSSNLSKVAMRVDRTEMRSCSLIAGAAVSIPRGTAGPARLSDGAARYSKSVQLSQSTALDP